MKLLHDISAGTFVRWAWGYITARNGHEWANPNVRRLHLYPLHRKAGPSYEIGNHSRWNWSPWGHRHPGTEQNEYLAESIREVLNPLCGRLPTTSRRPRFSWAAEWWSDGGNQCARCQQIADERGLNPAFRDNIQSADPWNVMTNQQRMTTPDPISGR